MIITIAGDVGSGKSTILKLLAKEEPDFEIIDMGALRRAFAKEKGMTIEEFNAWAVENPEEGDKQFDKKVVSEVLKKKNVILSTWLGPLFYPHSLKIYLSVDPNTAAKRIFDEKNISNIARNETIVETIEDQKHMNLKRMMLSKEQYERIYGFNPFDKTSYDVVIDTTNKTPENIVKEIITLKNSKNLYKRKDNSNT